MLLVLKSESVTDYGILQGRRLLNFAHRDLGWLRKHANRFMSISEINLDDFSEIIRHDDIFCKRQLE